MRVNIVCPHCEVQGNTDDPCDGEFEINCPSCDKNYSVLLGTVRSKRSRGHKGSNSREYDLRYWVGECEGYLQFHNNDYEDIELRAKDKFVIAKVDNQARALQNLTIAKYWMLNQPSSNSNVQLIVAICSILLLFLAIVVTN